MSVNLGDIFQLGEHYLLCGDTTDKYIINNFLADRKINAIVCDPPYAVGYVETQPTFKGASKHKPIANDQLQTEESYKEFTKAWLEGVKPFFAQKNSIYIFNSDKMLFALRDGMREAGITFSQLLIWVKNNSVMGRLNYLSQHELIAYGWYGTHQFQKSQDKSVIFYPKPTKSKLHPTMKPVGLLRRLILNSTRIADYVCDPFLGSGSTLIACEQTKRKCIGIELDPEYCQTIIVRWEKLTNQKAKKLKGK